MTKRKQVVTAPAPELKPGLKLDLGCGKNKREGFIGVDSRDFQGVDQVVDLVEEATPWNIEKKDDKFYRRAQTYKPWPWADGSVDEVHCSHFLEHLTGAERVHFFNELYRVLAPTEYNAAGQPIKGFATIIVPHWSNERAYGDPTHQWPPVTFFSFYYLNREWRAVNAPHCGYTCDFDVRGNNSISNEWTVKNQETQAFAQMHYINVATDLFLQVVRK